MKYFPVICGHAGLLLIYIGTNWQTALGVWLCAVATYYDLKARK